jgi:hypothetical protein
LAPWASRAAIPATKTTQLEPKGFFTLGQRKDHWWLITPDGKPFFTLIQAANEKVNRQMEAMN